jgi:hypothetical protein
MRKLTIILASRTLAFSLLATLLTKTRFSNLIDQAEILVNAI